MSKTQEQHIPAAPAPDVSPYVIEMRHITKEFPGIKANDDITLQLKRGEIHALLGENGAGNLRTGARGKNVEIHISSIPDMGTTIDCILSVKTEDIM